MEDNSIVQKIIFVIIHATSLWFLLGLITVSLASWRLSAVLTAHNARDREAELARKTAIAYAIIAVCLWILSWVLL